jgi:hypothetical protein
MSETRSLAYDPDLGFTTNPTRNDGTITDPTDAGRVELAIAALTHGGRELPDVEAYSIPSLNDATYNALFHLAILRDALARDAAAKEAEQAQEREVKALRPLLHEAYMGNLIDVARRAYELGARAPEGGA